MWWENYDPCYPDQPVVDLYLPIWASQPSFRSKPAFVWEEDSAAVNHRRHGGSSVSRSLTYAGLNSAASAIASRLLVPLRRGDTVLVLCPPGLRLVELLFACQRAGLVMVPVIPPEPSSFWPPSKQTPHHHHLLRALSQTRPKAAVAPDAYISAVRRSLSSPSSSPPRGHLFCGLLQNPDWWLSADDLDGTADETAASEYVGHKPDDVYLVQYTSGATGMPKPVLVTAGAASHNVRAARRAYDLVPGSMIVSWLPQYHDCGLMFLLLTVVAGATCVLCSPAAFLRRPRLWLELVSQYKGTCTPVPSFALPLVMKRESAVGGSTGRPPLCLRSLRNLVLINEPIYAAPVEAFVARFASSAGLDPSCISPSYGLAENCTFVSTAWRRRKGITIPSYRKLLPSARLRSSTAGPGDEEDEGEDANMIIVVEEGTCEPAEDGKEGEIWVCSPSNAAGYLGHPLLTKEVFGARLRGRGDRGAGCRCYVRTGDRGVVMGKERYLYVMGRASDVITAANGLAEHPHYLETAAYCSCPELLRGGCVAAFELRPGSRFIAVVAELTQQQRGREVGDAVRLRHVCFGIRATVEGEAKGVRVGLVALVPSGTVPKTTSGKLQRWAAKEKLWRGEFPVVYELDFGDASETSPEGEGMGNVGEEDDHVRPGDADSVVYRRRHSLPSFL